MYQALYRSFRPETFDGILGQEHIVKILKNQINTETTSHAYLFCGTRGTGKTSTARILAKGMNCLASPGERPCGVCENCVSIKNGSFMDVIEIDAASNNGVENIRELRESVKYPPVAGRCKVYIIDEVHMLSGGAFNALLKTLEEPPENVMFILATTEPNRLPATILSRCLRLDFKRVPERQLKEGMKSICQKLGIKVEESALGLICANADGSVRDGLSLLDQCISGGGKTISRQEVLELIGASGEEVLMELTDDAANGRIAEALILLDRQLADGKDVRQLIKDWIGHYRNLLMTKYIKRPEELLNLSAENVERIRKQSERISLELIKRSILELSQTLSDAKWSTQPRILLELAIVRLASEGGNARPLPQSAAQKEKEAFSPFSASRGESKPSAASCGESESSAAPRGESKPSAAPLGEREPEDRPPWEEAEDETRPEIEPQTKSQTKPENRSLDDLWLSLFEDSATQKGSFLLLRMGSKLREVTEDSFVVEAGNDVTRGLLKSNEQLFSRLMEEKTGRKLRLVLSQEEAPLEDDQEQKARELAKSIGDTLGIDVEVR